jgi:hypothetical protein
VAGSLEWIAVIERLEEGAAFLQTTGPKMGSRRFVKLFKT